MTLNAAAVLGPAPLVYPAHPFAVAADGSPDWANQRLLTRYYAAAGASGVAVGVHTSQFELHHDKGLFAEALRQTAEVAAASGGDLRLVTGVVGDAAEAVAEAELAVSLGYRAALLSAYGMTDRSEQATLERARAIAEVMPVIGFYMQESVGGADEGGLEGSPQFRLGADQVARIDHHIAAQFRVVFEYPGEFGVAGSRFVEDPARMRDQLQVDPPALVQRAVGVRVVLAHPEEIGSDVRVGVDDVGGGAQRVQAGHQRSPSPGAAAANASSAPVSASIADATSAASKFSLIPTVSSVRATMSSATGQSAWS